jgi:hypothetical protein
MQKVLLLLTAVAILALTGCRHTDARPADVLDEEQMTAFLADAYLLEGFYAIETQYRYDAVSTEMLQRYDSLLAVYGFTREQLEHSFDYYSQHLDAYAAIHDSVVARLEAIDKSQPAAVSPAKTVANLDSMRRIIPKLAL